MLEGLQNAAKIAELRRRLIFTFALLGVYRVGVAIPTPGIDGKALAAFFQQASNTVFGLVNLFSGGALERFSIFALGIMPYISSSIILQLLTVVVPALERLSKEGELGRRKITQYTRYGTVGLSLLQGFFISMGLEQIQAPGGSSVVFHPGWGFRLMTMITLTSGTAFIMWLGEQITERGIGNGISLIIFAGIVASVPSAMTTTTEFVREGELSILVLLLILLVMVAVVAAIIFMERAYRRIPVQYAKRVVGRRVYGGQSSHLPLKINTSGVIPPIFASSVLIFPATIASFADHPWAQAVAGALAPGSLVYNLSYVFIPGIRPGQRTAEYIDRVLSRVTLSGAIYVALICVLPNLLVSAFNVPFYFGGTALLIVVGVALDTVAQIETQILMRNYEGFMKRGRLRGRRG